MKYFFSLYFSFREQYQSINLLSFPRTQSNQVSSIIFQVVTQRIVNFNLYLLWKYTHVIRISTINTTNQLIVKNIMYRSMFQLDFELDILNRTVRHARNFFPSISNSSTFKKKFPPPPKSIITNLISPRNTNSTPPPFPSTFEKLNARIKSPFRMALKSALKRHVAVANVVQPIDPRTR